MQRSSFQSPPCNHLYSIQAARHYGKRQLERIFPSLPQKERIQTDSMKEATTGTINLDDDDPLMVAKMIDFLYKTRYDDDRAIDEEVLQDIADQHSSVTTHASSTVEAPENQSAITDPQPTEYIKGPLVTNAKVYILGDKYDITSLRDVASRKYKEKLEDMWNHHTFAESAKIIYDNIVSENDALKKAIIDVTIKNMSQLLKRDDFLSTLRSNGDIATDLLCAMPPAPKSCSHCGGYRYPVCNSCHNTLRF
jgi:hypothetical protein